jgi:hypothetical protein
MAQKMLSSSLYRFFLRSWHEILNRKKLKLNKNEAFKFMHGLSKEEVSVLYKIVNINKYRYKNFKLDNEDSS